MVVFFCMKSECVYMCMCVGVRFICVGVYACECVRVCVLLRLRCLVCFC